MSYGRVLALGLAARYPDPRRLALIMRALPARVRGWCGRSGARAEEWTRGVHQNIAQTIVNLGVALPKLIVHAALCRAL